MPVTTKIKKKLVYIPFLFLVVIYCLFIFGYERHALHLADQKIVEHAKIVADDLWNFNHSGASEYLKLAAESGNYQKLSIINHNGEVFYEVVSEKVPPLYKVATQLKLIKKVSLTTPIEYNFKSIGWLEAIWTPRTILVHLIVFTLLSLIFLVFLLYLQILVEKRYLEEGVRNRTTDLWHEKMKAEKISQHLETVSAEVQALLDNSPVGIIYVDIDRVIQRVNPEIVKITGYTEKELIGNTTQILYTSKDIYNHHGNTSYPDLLKDGFCQVNSDIQRKDGSIVKCYWRGRLITSENEQQGAVWSLEDISIRVKMEEDLIKARNLESIGVLAGGIAHDFNNILVAILGNISLAEQLTQKDERVHNLMTSAKKASLRAKDLTAKLLTFASGGEPVKSAESLPELLEESTSFVLAGSNVKFDISFPDDLWPVNMDKSQINQVIQNLVVNADQAMPKGGNLNITCENIHLSHHKIPGLKENNYIRMTVEDNGLGISGKIINKIFDPFYSSKEKDANKGSGLGLSIVHSIISKHGGNIQVNSTPNIGTTFIIYLPAAQGKVVQENKKEALLAGKGSILIMDDEKMILNIAQEMLEFLGYTVTSVSNGAEAITMYSKCLCEGNKFDAVIIDLTIPGGIDGGETLKQLLQIDPDIKAIVSTGYSQDPILDNYHEIGFCGYIPKPYQVHEVSSVLSETLS